MFNFIPDAERLSQIFSQAIAPTFFLGAVAAFVSLMSSRLSDVMARIRALNAISEDDHLRAHLGGPDGEGGHHDQGGRQHEATTPAHPGTGHLGWRPHRPHAPRRPMISEAP